MAHPKSEQFIEKIEKIGETQAVGKAEPEIRIPPNKERFDALYTQPVEPQPDVRKVVSEKVSLMDEVANMEKRVDRMKVASTEQLLAQVDDAVGKIKELKDKLSAEGVSVKPTWEPTLRNKLTHIDETLKATLNKAGIEYNPPEAVAAPAKTPIERFLGYLENGQSQLDTLGGDVMRLQMNNQSLSPATMLAVQYKVGVVQQQLELFTGMLNKALEGMKTIFNTQI